MPGGGHSAAREGGGGLAAARQRAMPGYLIPSSEVTVVQGREGILGRGALGEVRLGRFKDIDVALKFLHMLRTDALSVQAMGGALSKRERQFFTSKFQEECRLMSEFKHPHIVPFFGVVVDETPQAEPLYLAMQYIPDGTLHALIHDGRYEALRSDDGEGGCVPLGAQLVALSGLFSALEYLGARQLIHRDVKPANILVVVVGITLVKVLLADFGEAKQLSQSMSRVSAAGTPVYMAPEMKEEEDAKTPKADVFSAGVVAVELNTGMAPRPGPEVKKEVRENGRLTPP
jgi:serine/threonine protein kinase